MLTEIEHTKNTPIYREAVQVVLKERHSNIKFIQRTFQIGYNHAARIIEAMEDDGILGPMDSSGKRPILAPHNDGGNARREHS